MIQVLAAPCGVGADGLDVAVGMGTDPHLRPGGRDHQVLDPPAGVLVGEQVKLKLEVPVELEVIGFNEGTGKNAGSLGSFRCASACRRLIVDVSGRGDKMRDEVWADQEDWLGAIITVKANDLFVDSAPARVDLVVRAVNDAPVALPQVVSTPEDQNVTVVLAGQDVDADPMCFRVVAQPAHGSLALAFPNVT